MKPQYKAALLSGLVYPGVGYLPYKKNIRAAIAIVLATIGLYGILQVSLMRIRLLMDQVLAGQVAQDMPSMLAALEKISQISMGWQDYAGYLLLFTWLVSVIDGYRVAKLQS